MQILPLSLLSTSSSIVSTFFAYWNAAGGLPIGKKESQDAAWQRVAAFFKEHLG